MLILSKHLYRFVVQPQNVIPSEVEESRVLTAANIALIAALVLFCCMLSSYSAQALTTLLQLLPELADFVVEQGEVFEISMQTPSGGEFWVSSAEGEITVGFEEYHTHFGWHEGTHPEEDATDAAAFIHQLKSGQLRLAVWYKGDAYVGSRPIESDEEMVPKNWLQRWLWRGRTVKVKSWA